MTASNRAHWDARYEHAGPAPLNEVVLSPELAAFDDAIPRSGNALELACGRGRGAVWLASRGLDVLAADVSPVAIRHATRLADAAGLGDRCRFLVADLDDGLPAGPPADVALCHLFRDPRLDAAIVDRLKPGGVLIIRVLSEVGAERGRFRAAPGELLRAFSALEVVTAGECDGIAWLIGRRH